MKKAVAILVAAFVSYAVWSMAKNFFYWAKDPYHYSGAAIEAIRRNFLNVGHDVREYFSAGQLCTPSHFSADGQNIEPCTIVNGGRDCGLAAIGVRCATVKVDIEVATIPGVRRRLIASRDNLCANMPPFSDDLPRGLKSYLNDLGCGEEWHILPFVIIFDVRDRGWNAGSF